jgi:hypothetical protein
MKVKKFLKAKKVPLIITGVVLLVAAIGGSYYLATKQSTKFSTNSTKTSTDTATSTPAQENAEDKGDTAATNSAASGNSASSTTTTPSATVQTPSLTNGSLTVLLDPSSKSQATVYFYGPAGTYGVQKLVNGAWTTIVSKFDYIGSGGYGIDTISGNADYKIFLLVNGTQTAISGDTAVSWQAILDKGTLTVPLAG